MAAEEELDLLVCGGCKQDFPFVSFNTFIQHKQSICSESSRVRSLENQESTLLCQSCPEAFSNPMTLLHHAQNQHALNIYLEQLEPCATAAPIEDDSEEQCTTSCCNPGRINKPKGKKSALRVDRRLSTASTSDVGTQVAEREAVSSGVCLCVKNRSADSCCENARCCSNENCGVTVMPGTHEPAKKCCQAVVPKKRKRHMETKHMPSVKARRRALSISRSLQSSAKAGPASIVIDFGSNHEYPHSPSSHSESSMTDMRDYGLKSSSKNNTGLRTSFSRGDFKKHSVIIPPGGTFSVPAYITQVHRTPTTAPPNTPPNRAPLTVESQTEGIGNSTTTHSQGAQIGPLTTQDNSKLVSYVTSLLQKSVDSSQMTRDDSNLLRTLFNSEQPEPASVPMTSTSRETQDILPILESSPAQDKNDESANQENNDDSNQDALELSQDMSEITQNDVMDGGNELQGSDMNGHKKKRYPTSRPFKCDQCDNSFNQRIHLRKHQSKHTGIKPYKCEQCDYATVERSHLKVHIRVHTGEKPFKCTYCEYATAQNSTLKIHLKRHHGSLDISQDDEQLTLHCSTCQKPFPQRGLLDNHVAKEHQMRIESELELDQGTSHQNTEKCSSHETQVKSCESLKQIEPQMCVGATPEDYVTSNASKIVTAADQEANVTCLDEFITDLQSDNEAVNFQKLLEVMMEDQKSVNARQDSNRPVPDKSILK